MRALGGIFLGAMLATSAASEPPRIGVFTTARYPIATASTPAVLVYNLRDLFPSQHARHGNVQLGADMLGHQFAVSRDNLDSHFAVVKRGESGTGALLGRIEEGRKTREDQFRLVADDGMGMVKGNVAPSDA